MPSSTYRSEERRVGKAWRSRWSLIKGPTAPDRAVAGDCVDVLTDMALVLVAMYSGRGIYLDIAIVTAILGFLSQVLIGKYLEGTL